MALDPLANISQTGVLQVFTSGTSALYASYVITALLLAFFTFSSRDKYPELPWANPNGPSEFMAKPKEVLREGSGRFKDQPYKLNTEHGPVLIIPPRYVDELKSNKKLDFLGLASENNNAHFSGFKPLSVAPSLPQIINKHLTKALLSLTKPISIETSLALKDTFTESKGWTEITPFEIMKVVSRMSSRIFMGQELCNDQEWIQASSDYVLHLFKSRGNLKRYPKLLRRLVHCFLSESLTVRQKLQRCRDVLRPHIEKRQVHIKEALARGEKNPYDDAIEWFAQEEKEYDEATAQISLSLAAIHTTSDLLTQTMFDIAKHPELIAPLREEVIGVLKTHGLKKSAFQKLVLMDSCFKESQRLRPVLNTYFMRRPLENVTLSDGFVIKKGTRVAMDGGSIMMNEEIYPEPSLYKPQRFIEMRQTPGEEGRAHLVSVSQIHFAFGHGAHACPGRFFAANEVKIAMAHILLKYDWKLTEDSEDLKPVFNGTNISHNPRIKFLVRRREEELDLDSLQF